ncbi:SPOR domain-containing protein [Aurantiacibacter rhizosphaerae]|nr:SPOR domain-containing protein [Aurantiacibacter rhizosphaerae]
MLALAAPLGATVRDGVDAWSRGDYAAAVAQWQGPAAAGDADAMFNMGQAYRLGRGVPQDMQQAERLYLAAAQAGHLQAADTYGLMLFQDGRREEALPYVLAASRRGDPRAQYLIGIAHFNGDLVPRDWERAYALLSLANGAGLPQAGPAIGQMDNHIPVEQRQAGVALSRQIEIEAEQARAVQLTAADLSASVPAETQELAQPQPRPATVAQAEPRPSLAISVSPSVAAARDAVLQARQATGTASPAEAGASYTQETVAAAPAQPRQAQVAAARPSTSPPAAPPAQGPAARSDGPWRVQLGAFGVPGNAERLWNRLSSRPEIAGRQRLLLKTGRVTRLQAAGYATRAEAQTACSRLQRAGQECLVTRN